MLQNRSRGEQLNESLEPQNPLSYSYVIKCNAGKTIYDYSTKKHSSIIWYYETCVIIIVMQMDEYRALKNTHIPLQVSPSDRGSEYLLKNTYTSFYNAVSVNNLMLIII